MVMELSTVEKFILLAQQPQKGGFVIGDIQFNYGLVGGLLLEMASSEMITIENKRLVFNEISSEDEIFVEISHIISSSNKTRKIAYWLNKLSRKSKYFKWNYINHLVQKNMLKIVHKNFLGLFPYRKTYLTDSETRNNLIIEIRSTIFEIDREPDLLLLGLIEACKMYEVIAKDKKERKILKLKLKNILKESPIAEAVDKTIKGVQSAMIGAIVAGSVASSVAVHH